MQLNESVVVASAQYPFSFLKDWADYQIKLNTWFEQAAQQNAKLLVFPEYFAMELVTLLGADVYQSLDRQIAAIQSLHGDFVNLFSNLVVSYQVTVVAGIFPLQVSDQRVNNRCWVFHPDGSSDYQDKLLTTKFEFNELMHSRSRAGRSACWSQCRNLQARSCLSPWGVVVV